MKKLIFTNYWEWIVDVYLTDDYAYVCCRLAIGYIAIHSLIPDLFSLLPYENAAYDFIAPQKWKHPNPPSPKITTTTHLTHPQKAPPQILLIYIHFFVYTYILQNILQPYIFSETLTHLKKRVRCNWVK